MGASTVWLLLPLLPPGNSSVVAVLMTFTVVGALLPDLDAIESKIKHDRVSGIKPFMPVARAINRELGHRGLLHSLWGWVGWTLLILPLGSAGSWLPVVASSLGYFSHLACDACTPKRKRKHFHLLPIGWRVTTGSEYEELFFMGFAVCFLALVVRQMQP